VVSNGIVNPIRLIIVPILSQTTNGVTAAGNDGFSPLISPFASEPGTCSPYQITDFNVTLSGKSLYPEAFNYDYQEYKNTVGKFAKNISLTDYNNLYGYIVVDLKKRKYELNTTQSINIKGRNDSAANLDLLCFVEYEKAILLNVLTGKVEGAA
jgi:ribosomal protein S17E